jgi:hypothetical protein
MSIRAFKGKHPILTFALVLFLPYQHAGSIENRNRSVIINLYEKLRVIAPNLVTLHLKKQDTRPIKSISVIGFPEWLISLREICVGEIGEFDFLVVYLLTRWLDYFARMQIERHVDTRRTCTIFP